MVVVALIALSLLSVRADCQDAVGAWPPVAQTAARALAQKYGEPDEATARMLVWHDRRPWRRVAVYRESVANDFPFPHHDLIEDTVNYVVPESKATTLLKFNDALIIDVADGTLSAKSDSERANTLALNLADELVRGQRSIGAARRAMSRAILLEASGKSSPYMDGLRFAPASMASPFSK